MKELILIIDDNWQNKERLEKILKNQYNIIRTSSLSNSIEIIEKNSIALIILNAGLYFCADIVGFLDFNSIIIPIVFLCSEAYIVEINCSIYDYLTQPYAAHLIKNKVKNMIELGKYKNNLEMIAVERSTKMDELADAFTFTLCSIIEYRNIETKKHMQRISMFTKSVLEFLSNNMYDEEFTQKKIDFAVSASMLHDIGMVGVSDVILNKQTELNPQEELILSKHTTIGCKIVEKIKNTCSNEYDYINICYDICKCHHERWDGSGYPNKYSGKDIPLYAQVVGMVDLYDVLTTKNNYMHEDAINLMKNEEAGMFSPVLLEAINLISDELFYIKEEFHD